MRTLTLLPIVSIGILLAGCHTDMWRQPKQAPMDMNDLFADKAASRPLIPGTIARGKLREDGAFFTGIENGKWVDSIPVPVTKELMAMGQEKYQIFCTPCHGQLGDGKGMIAIRGFQVKRPVGNYHTERLRNMPVGHFYNVITNGYGAMYSYASRIEPKERWAVVAYVRALQLSQNAKLEDLPAEERQALLSGNPMEPATSTDSQGGGH
jgi:mono/diheme cytochrome c family protein